MWTGGGVNALIERLAPKVEALRIGSAPPGGAI